MSRNAWVEDRTMRRLPAIALDSPLPTVTHKVAITHS